MYICTHTDNYFRYIRISIFIDSEWMCRFLASSSNSLDPRTCSNHLELYHLDGWRPIL